MIIFVCSVLSDSLWPHGPHGLPGSFVHGVSQARISGCHFLLQQNFWTQGSNPTPPSLLHLLHWKVAQEGAERYFRLLWIRNQSKEIIFYILFIFIFTVNTRFLDQRGTDLFSYAPSHPQDSMIKAAPMGLYGRIGVTRVQKKNPEIMNLGGHIRTIVQVSLFPPERRTEMFAL